MKRVMWKSLLGGGVRWVVGWFFSLGGGIGKEVVYQMKNKHTHPVISILPKVYIIGEHFSEKMFSSAQS